MRFDTWLRHRRKIQDSIDYIETDLTRSLRLDELAIRSGVAPHHFHRLFREITGQPPLKYVRRLRLERAAVLLKRTNQPVTRVAFQAGYASHEGFCRAFKSMFGVSPILFRREHPRDRLPSIEVTTRTLPPQSLACIRHVGDYARAIAAETTLKRWGVRRGLDVSAPLKFYWDDLGVTEPANARCDLALPLDGPNEKYSGDSSDLGEHVRVRRLPAQEYAIARFEGNYHIPDVHHIYGYLLDVWIPEHGREFSDAPPFESYEASAAGRLLATSIHIPLV